MKEAKSNDNSWTFFLIIIVTILMITFAAIRNSNDRKIEAQEKAAVTGKLLSLQSDINGMKLTIQEMADDVSEAKRNSVSAISISKDNSDRIAVLESKDIKQEVISPYVKLAYCTTDYDNLTKMFLLKCKDYPVQTIG